MTATTGCQRQPDRTYPGAPACASSAQLPHRGLIVVGISQYAPCQRNTGSSSSSNGTVSSSSRPSSRRPISASRRAPQDAAQGVARRRFHCQARHMGSSPALAAEWLQSARAQSNRYFTQLLRLPATLTIITKVRLADRQNRCCDVVSTQINLITPTQQGIVPGRAQRGYLPNRLRLMPGSPSA